MVESALGCSLTTCPSIIQFLLYHHLCKEAGLLVPWSGSLSRLNFSADAHRVFDLKISPTSTSRFRTTTLLPPTINLFSAIQANLQLPHLYFQTQTHPASSRERVSNGYRQGCKRVRCGANEGEVIAPSPVPLSSTEPITSIDSTTADASCIMSPINEADSSTSVVQEAPLSNPQASTMVTTPSAELSLQSSNHLPQVPKSDTTWGQGIVGSTSQTGSGWGDQVKILPPTAKILLFPTDRVRVPHPPITGDQMANNLFPRVKSSYFPSLGVVDECWLM